MAKGDYLTKPRFGKPADAVEQKAADWLEANCGYEGEEVMKSLAALLRGDGWCSKCGCGNDAHGFAHLESCHDRGGKAK